MLIGYIRISTVEQNESRQLELGKKFGVEQFYIDKCSGKNADRPKLKEMLSFVRKGDVVWTESISRLARNVKDLLDIVETLKKKEVTFVSSKENIDTSTPTGKFCLTLFGAMADLERETILDRQREGIELAKQRGVYKGRKPKEYDKEKFKKMVIMWKHGQIKPKEIRKEFDITSTTLYRWFDELEKNGEI